MGNSDADLCGHRLGSGHCLPVLRLAGVSGTGNRFTKRFVRKSYDFFFPRYTKYNDSFTDKPDYRRHGTDSVGCRHGDSSADPCTVSVYRRHCHGCRSESETVAFIYSPDSADGHHCCRHYYEIGNTGPQDTGMPG